MPLNRKTTHRSLYAQQQGAALVVGLLLLLVLTVLAISGMGSAALQSIMAGNEQYKQNAFQAAEGGIADIYAHGDYNPNLAPQPLNGVAMPGSTIGDTYDTTLSVLDGGAQVPCQGNEVSQSGQGTGGAGCIAYEILAVGHSLRSATATNIQGLNKVGAGGSPPIGPISPSITAFN